MWTVQFTAEDEAYLEAKGAAKLSERVRPEHEWAWMAFNTLRGSRASGLGLGQFFRGHHVRHRDKVAFAYGRSHGFERTIK